MSDTNTLQRVVFSLDQLHGAILRYADQLEEALQAKDDGRPEEGPSLDLLAAIKQVLESKQAEAIDTIVEALNDHEDNMALCQQKIDKLRVAWEKMDAARTKIRLFLLNWIDGNLPEDARKLQGRLWWIRTQNNGGLPALVVREETAVPREYFIVRPKLTLPATITEEQVETLQAFLEQFIPSARIEGLDKKPELDEDAVRMALGAQLDVPGCRLERGRQLRHSKPKAAPRLPRGAKALPTPPESVQSVHTEG